MSRSLPDFFRLTSVTRWLLVVAGCIGLELVQPALAADPESTGSSEATTSETLGEPASSPSAERGGNTLLYPADGDSRILGGAVAPADQFNLGWLVAGIFLVGGGIWVWLKRGKMTGRISHQKLIGIEETKSLGSRQFLVVASCDGRRFLLGVSPGRINTLADLDDLPTSAAVVPPPPSEDLA